MSVIALVLVLGAAVSHAAWNVIAHGASRSGLPFLWCAAVASTLIWAAVVPFTGGLGTDDVAGFALGIGVSAVLHFVYMLVLQRGYASGDLSTVYATARGVGPLISVVVAVLVLGERPSPAALVGVGLVIAGVVTVGLLGRPRTRRRGAGVDLGVVFGVLTGFAIAAYTLWDAASIRTWEISPVAYMVGCTLLEVPFYTVLLGRRLPSVVGVAREQWRALLVFGMLSPLSYILVLTAITLAPVALVAPMRELSVVLVSLYGALVLRESHPRGRIAASAIVAGGVLLMAL